MKVDCDDQDDDDGGGDGRYTDQADHEERTHEG